MTRSFYSSFYGKELPKNIISLTSSIPGAPWTAYTTEDKLNEKRRQQAYRLKLKRGMSNEGRVVNCIVWAFFNDTLPFHYRGWWLYVRTMKGEFCLTPRYARGDYHPESNWHHLISQVMELFPCGMLPMVENYHTWIQAFAKRYAVSSMKRKLNGSTVARCEIKNGSLINIYNHEPIKFHP